MSMRASGGAEMRKKGYKIGVDVEEARRRREEGLIEIRKSKREDILLKKRREAILQPGHDLDTHRKLESLPAMILGVWSADAPIQLHAATLFRKLLSFERYTPTEEIIKAGVIPRFVEFLSRSDLPQLQFEAAWVLTNIASGTSEHTRVVIEHGAVPKFVQLLSSPNADVREQAVWALGNIAGDSLNYRDFVLRNGALFGLLVQLNEGSKISMLRNATWALSNLCRGRPPPFEHTRAALPVLKRLIHSTDDDVLTDSCWALSYLSDGSNDRIQAVIELGACPRLVELLLYPSPIVVVPALRTVGNIVSGDDAQTQCIINGGALPCLFQLLTQSYSNNIKKEACWAISNITAGTRDQVQAVIDAKIISPLVELLQHAEFGIKKEAVWAISNITCGGDTKHIDYLASQGCIKPMCDFLTCTDSKIVTVCLEFLENILKVGEDEKDLGITDGVNIYALMIDDCCGLEKIENLQTHNNYNIYNKAVKILEKYWVEKDEEETAADESSFQFRHGAASKTPPGGFKFA